jgi:arylsulfatase A-like enzyme
MRRALFVVVVAGFLGLGAWLVSSSIKQPVRVVVFDLAERLPYAARSTARETILFGWPDSEPHLVKGFGGDPETRGDERFHWVRQGAAIRIPLKEARDRALIFDIEAYQGIEGQRLTLSANGRRLGVQEIPSARSRVRFEWPAAAQSDANELTLVFLRAIVPAKQKGGSGDTRDFAAALFSLTLGSPEDKTFDLLRERETPRAYEINRKDGVPSFILPGMSQTSFAFRLPRGATLELESGLPAWSVASGGKGTLQIAFDSSDGISRPSVSLPLDAQGLKPAKVRLDGAPGTPFMVRLDVISDNPGVTFAQIRAPRILGEPMEPREPEPASVSVLRASLRAGKPNVLFIVLDAARAVSFRSYGYTRGTTPNIDRFAREGFMFENAYTPAVYTLAAMSSVWTSQPPDRHHGDVAFNAPLPKDRLMLAEILTAQGIHTAGFVANGVAGTLNGFERGFSEFNEPWKTSGSQASSFRHVIPGFLDRMKKDGKRFFAYVHYREPHEPYDPPPPFNTAFGPDAPIPKVRRDGGDVAKQWLEDINSGAVRPSADEIDHLRRLYDGNLAMADHEVGYLRDELESRGLLDNTVVIVTGDHGEALFEHGHVGHNGQVFEESARVPLIVTLPKAFGGAASPGARVPGLVDLTDIAPTVLDLFGLRGAGGSARAFQGASLVPYFVDPLFLRADEREVLTRTVWQRPVYALRNASHTFIYNTATAEFSLFDRATTPRLEGADHDYAPRAPIALRETYRQGLLAGVASLKQKTVVGDKTSGMSVQQCEELKALNYISAKTNCRSK